jgi:hypothetical protein
MKIKNIITNFVAQHKKIISFIVLLLAGMLSTLYVEYRFQYDQNKWLATRIFLISVAIVLYGGLPKITRDRNRKKIIAILIATILLYAINLVANLVNVYHLGEYQRVQNFCAPRPEQCQAIVDWFYQLKLYRFVSLTSYFFSYVIFFLVGLLFSEEIYKKTTRLLKTLPRVKLEYAWVFYFLLIYLIFQQLIFVFSAMSKRVVSVFYTLGMPYEERWEASMGGRYSFGWMWTYTRFINEQTAENTIILVPDRAAPWEMEGNPYYTRWFVYPRKMVQLNGATEIPAEADVVLITYGIFGYHKKVFPTFPISNQRIDEIVLIDRTTLEVTKQTDIDFRPENYQDAWGLIRLKP